MVLLCTFNVVEHKANALGSGHIVDRRRLQGIFNVMAKLVRKAFSRQVQHW